MTHPLTTERIDAISKELNTTYKDTVIRELKADEFNRKTAHLKNLKNAYAHYDRGDEAMGKRIIRLLKASITRRFGFIKTQSFTQDSHLPCLNRIRQGMQRLR